MLKIWSGRIAPLAFACVTLAACGGGDGNSENGGTSNPPPIITISVSSALDVTVAENTSGSFYQAAASASDGSNVTYSLAGGADVDAFALSGEGKLSFTDTPNFDLYNDADNDNAYEVSIKATAGAASATINLVVDLTNDREGISVTRIATGLVEPVGMSRSNVADEILVAERGGKIVRISGTTGTTSLEYQLFAGIGLLDITYDAGNNFYAGISALTDSVGGVYGTRIRPSRIDSEYLAKGGENLSGSIMRGDDGQIYVTLGSAVGQIARDGGESGGLFMTGDPYAGASVRWMPLQQIGRGIRAAGGLAMVGDKILVADQGGEFENELSFFPTRSIYDLTQIHFAWPFSEGNHIITPATLDGEVKPSFTYPVGTARKTGSGIVLGCSYAGANASLQGQFVFGDRNGSIFTVPVEDLTDGKQHTSAEMEDRTEDFRPDVGSLDQIVEIVSDGNGVIYILDGDGEVFRVNAS